MKNDSFSFHYIIFIILVGKVRYKPWTIRRKSITINKSIKRWSDIVVFLKNRSIISLNERQMQMHNSVGVNCTHTRRHARAHISTLYSKRLYISRCTHWALILYLFCTKAIFLSRGQQQLQPAPS